MNTIIPIKQKPPKMKNIVYIPQLCYKTGNTNPIINADTQFKEVANPKAFSLFKISALYTHVKGPKVILNTISYKNIRLTIKIVTAMETFFSATWSYVNKDTTPVDTKIIIKNSSPYTNRDFFPNLFENIPEAKENTIKITPDITVM